MQRIQENRMLLGTFRPLHWFVVGWILFVGLGDSFPLQIVSILLMLLPLGLNLIGAPQNAQKHSLWLMLLAQICLILTLACFSHDMSIIFILLLFTHLGLYLIVFTKSIRRRSQWLVLLAQTGIIFALAWADYDISIALALSMTWIVAALAMLKGRTLLVSMSGYLLLLGLFTWQSGRVIPWNASSSLPVKYLFVLTFFLASLSLVLYFQQRYAHQRTQVLLHDLDTAHAQLSAYALRVEELTTLAERQRLARELHDTLSQGLVGVLMQLDAANSHFNQDHYPQGRTIMLQAIERARTMLKETRYVISDLRMGNSIHPDDLPELVQEEVERFTSATGIPCQAELDMLALTPAKYCEQVLRVITEGLTNIARHAQARQVWVSALTSTGRMEVVVRDDGVGFELAHMVNLPGHYGLIGLRERARLIQGHIDIVSAPGQGTCIRLRLPQVLQPEQETTVSTERVVPIFHTTIIKETVHE